MEINHTSGSSIISPHRLSQETQPSGTQMQPLLHSETPKNGWQIFGHPLEILPYCLFLAHTTYYVTYLGGSCAQLSIQLWANIEGGFQLDIVVVRFTSAPTKSIQVD
jgi:hypothetical protein